MAFQLMHSSSQDTLKIGYPSLFTRLINTVARSIMFNRWID